MKTQAVVIEVERDSYGGSSEVVATVSGYEAVLFTNIEDPDLSFEISKTHLKEIVDAMTPQERNIEELLQPKVADEATKQLQARMLKIEEDFEEMKGQYRLQEESFANYNAGIGAIVSNIGKLSNRLETLEEDRKRIDPFVLDGVVSRIDRTVTGFVAELSMVRQQLGELHTEVGTIRHSDQEQRDAIKDRLTALESQARQMSDRLFAHIREQD